MTWWIHELYQDGRVVELLSWIFWAIFSITLHELAHGWAALWQGDDTPRTQGRMTLNPLVHMGPWSLLVFALIGIAWGLMPTDPSRYRWRRKGRIVVAGAGPAMNLALAAAAFLLVTIWLAVGPSETKVYANLATFLFVGAWLNVVLALLNLIPVPPLDGSQILSGLSYRMYELYRHPNAPMVGLILIVLVFFTGLGSFLFAFAIVVSVLAVDGPGLILGNPSVTEVVSMFGLLLR